MEDIVGGADFYNQHEGLKGELTATCKKNKNAHVKLHLKVYFNNVQGKDYAG